MGKRWLPLESNPDVLNTFSSKLGLNVVDYAFCDIYGLDEVRDLTILLFYVTAVVQTS